MQLIPLESGFCLAECIVRLLASRRPSTAGHHTRNICSSLGRPWPKSSVAKPLETSGNRCIFPTGDGLGTRELMDTVCLEDSSAVLEAISAGRGDELGYECRLAAALLAQQQGKCSGIWQQQLLHTGHATLHCCGIAAALQSVSSALKKGRCAFVHPPILKKTSGIYTPTPTTTPHHHPTTTTITTNPTKRTCADIIGAAFGIFPVPITTSNPTQHRCRHQARAAQQAYVSELAALKHCLRVEAHLSTWNAQACWQLGRGPT